jgi:hypothetical protein
MGDVVEDAVRMVGVERQRVLDYIWRCKCRNRKRRYHEVVEWAEGVMAGQQVDEARAGLEEMLAKAK